MKKLPQGLNYWRLLLRVFWYNWEHRGSLISLSYDLKVKTRACRALSELWACSSQTSKKSNSHKTLQGWIAYLNIKDLLSLNHLTHNHINCISKKKSIEYSATEKTIRVFKEGFVLMRIWEWNWYIQMLWLTWPHTNTRLVHFGKSTTLVFIVVSIENELIPLVSSQSGDLSRCIVFILGWWM